MKQTAMDWLDHKPVNEVKPEHKGRTRLQVVIGAEDTWLAPYLIPTEIYISPHEARA